MRSHVVRLCSVADTLSELKGRLPTLGMQVGYNCIHIPNISGKTPWYLYNMDAC